MPHSRAFTTCKKDGPKLFALRVLIGHRIQEIINLNNNDNGLMVYFLSLQLILMGIFYVSFLFSEELGLDITAVWKVSRRSCCRRYAASSKFERACSGNR